VRQQIFGGHSTLASLLAQADTPSDTPRSCPGRKQ
jgi:hypothetical protein